MTAQVDLPHPGLAIATRGLVHIYRSEGHDVAALSGIDLHVAPGEMIGLLGPSGAGKSTLLTLLGGLLPPSAGKIFLGDIELTALTSTELDLLRATQVSLMLQGAHRNLIPYLTPRQNLAFAAQAARRLKVDDLPGVDAVLEVVDLAAYADEPLASLSPGQLQLVALAACIAVRPGVILADEPTSQLDQHARDMVLDALAHINADLGTTIVVVTHDPQVAARMPRTVTIRDGRIGGEGRAGQEFAVVTADGFLPLPAHALDALPPGTLLRVHERDGTWTLLPESTPSSDSPEDPS